MFFFLIIQRPPRSTLDRSSAASDVYKRQRTAYTGKTSKMSLALAWGLVSARTLMQMMQKHFDESFDNPFSARVSEGALTYISELIWREFYRYPVSYTHLRAHETVLDLVCRLLLEKKTKKHTHTN